MQSFQIISMQADLPKLGERQFSLLRAPRPGSRTTVVLGENGSGKSTLLRDLALTFRGLGGAPERRRRSAGWSILRALEVAVDGQELRRLDRGEVRRLQFEPAESGDLARFLPSRVIALSFTPFDKFPYWEPPLAKGAPAHREDEFYVYLGFKTESGRTSAKSRLLKTVDQLLFSPMIAEKASRVTSVLSAIGYGPRLTVSYSLSPQLRVALRERDRPAGAPRTRSAPDPERIARQMQMFDTFPELRGSFPRLATSEHLKVEAQFGEDEFGISFDPEVLRQLQSVGVLSVSAVELYKLDNDRPADLLELSSGELNILSGFLGLAVHLIEGCLILIDEPENSLHPAWQIRYAEMLDAVLDRFDGCHCIIATHSPLIVSGAARAGSSLVRLDQDPVAALASDFAEESPDATLVNAFDVVTAKNSYVRQLALEALTLVENGEAEGERAQKIAARLAHIQEQIPADDAIRSVVSALVARILG